MKCPECGSDDTRTSGSLWGRFSRKLIGRPRFRCRDCRSAWTAGPDGPIPFHSALHRGFLRRHPAFTVIAVLVLMLGLSYTLLALFNVVPGIADFLQNEKIVTGTSGKEYTIGGALQRGIEKKEEREKQERK